MKLILTISALLILMSFPQEIKAQDYLDTIPQLIWQQNKFQEALDLIDQHRPSATQNVFLLDLYKSVCYCGLKQYSDGRNYFQWILRSYRDLNPQILEYINQSKSNCKQEGSALQTPSRPLLATIKITSPPGPAKVIGKDFYDRTPETSRTSIIREIPDSVYLRRLHQDINMTSLIEQLKHIGIDKASIDTTDHFIVIIANQEGKQNKAHEISNRLEKALSFYQEFYSLQVPQQKITAYSCTDQSQFMQLAEQIHGVELSQSLIGYTSQPDLSMVVYNPSLNAATFKHELVHILFNYNVPYLEPWLSEGIPALYEVSRFRGDSLLGIPAWRDDLLSRVGDDESMKLEPLLSMDWSQFEEWESEKYNPLFKACLARTFVLFLQQTGKLQNVYQAYRNQDPCKYDPYLVTKVLDQPMPKIQSDFDAWFTMLH